MTQRSRGGAKRRTRSAENGLYFFFNDVLRLVDGAAKHPKIAKDRAKADRIPVIRKEIIGLGSSKLVDGPAGCRLFVATVDGHLAEIESMIRTG